LNLASYELMITLT